MQYRLTLRTELNAKFCRKAELKLLMERLKRLETSVPTSEEKTKDGIVGWCLKLNAAFRIDQHLRDFSFVVDGTEVLVPPFNVRSRFVDQSVSASRVKLYAGGVRPNPTEGQLR
ncbi:hypothetical protein TcWFU_009809 [Taenia crassiceps]|uniref:Uncharacterized protein n=1 Tax=Taenia crassiceps TaxID=6207 RepID=A0ABR4QVW4_9CEST